MELFVGIVFLVAVTAYFVMRARDEGGVDMNNLNVEVPTVHTLEELNAMTKVEIDEYAMGFGLKLDRRWAKKRMINECFANGLVRE